ncbi:MAG: hypothetical protein AB8F94_20050 [Saprospiraceae bacterium]
MTLVEFNENLNKIDFKLGDNIQSLENYLLACLTQLEIHKSIEPSYQIFLLIFDQARNGSKVDFDPSWKELNRDEFDYLSELEGVKADLQSLAADLIQTREIQSHPDYVKKENRFEWDSEGGVRFYNGTTPDAILGYAATRFEGEYHESAFQEKKVTWKEFTYPIWTGISYE